MMEINHSSSGSGSETTRRQSESPARTIDSHDSTNGSMDTIVDRSLSLSREEMLQATIAQSTNTTNTQQRQAATAAADGAAESGGSLTHSQASMLPRHGLNSSSSDEEQQQLQLNKLTAQTQQHHHQLDAQNHIYSSPVYDQKPPLKLTAATLVAEAVANSQAAGGGDGEKPKLITHEEFQKQLQEATASRAATLDSRICKKQRFPPELIKIKDGDGGSSTHSSKASKQRRTRRDMASSDCCSAFPLQIVLGTLQLLLAISLVALGSLLIVRDAALSTAGCGIWTGLIAAITGSLGVVSIRKTQTAFLALSLICIATSTLALAISGVGLSRDINHSNEKFDLLDANHEVSAASSLIFALFLHFVVSVVSVYRCALQLCAKHQNNALRDVIVNSNMPALDKEKVQQYMKALSMSSTDKENPEKLAAMWMYAAQMGSLPPQSGRKSTPPARPIVLIPARAGSTTMLAGPPPPGLIMPPPAAMLPPPYRGSMPYIPPGSVIYAPHPHPGVYRTHRSAKSSMGPGGQNRRRRAGNIMRAGKMDANRRQRCKSEADIAEGQAFQYTGLDRAIADNFLARQEQSNTGSHIEYTSSSSGSDTYGRKAPCSRASSKTKIICRDVVM